MTLCFLHFIIITIINLFTLFSPGNKTKQNETKENSLLGKLENTNKGNKHQTYSFGYLFVAESAVYW